MSKILTPTLDVVENVNNYLFLRIPGEEKVYLSFDSILNNAANDNLQADMHCVDFLNSIKCSYLPNYQMQLKVGVPTHS